MMEWNYGPGCFYASGREDIYAVTETAADVRLTRWRRPADARLPHSTLLTAVDAARNTLIVGLATEDTRNMIGYAKRIAQLYEDGDANLTDPAWRSPRRAGTP